MIFQKLRAAARLSWHIAVAPIVDVAYYLRQLRSCSELNGLAAAQPTELICDAAQGIPPPSLLERSLNTCSMPVWFNGRCPICESKRGFKVSSRNLREAIACVQCGQWNRKRQIAAVLRHELRIPVNSKLREMPQKIWIMETGPLADAFSESRTIKSEFFDPSLKSGSLVGGVLHEDAMNPSFKDQTLDLVISSDVFEHIPDPYLAHQEVFRCLRPGGAHIFTVPYLNECEKDDIRARIVDGCEVYFSEKQFHGDPLRPEGVLVYTLFGREMLAKLEEIGFQVKSSFVHSTSMGILGRDSIVFVARRPGD